MSEPPVIIETPAKKDNLFTTNEWEQVGIHRGLGGFFHNFVIMIASAVIGAIFIGFLTNLLYPYPEIQGYGKVANGFFFALIYKIFDFGTAFGIERFIAEYRIKNPKKMMEYVQFFVWYQMFTGIIQVTGISIYVLWYMPTTEYAYLSWLFLIIAQKQWPGMLGTFKSVLNGMQQYNKTNVLNFITSDVIQNLTNVIFILFGKWIGTRNPAIGPLMGAALGTMVGTYVDDFFAMFISFKFLEKMIKPFGLSGKDLWGMTFQKDVVKKCLWFGAQVSVTPIVNSLTGTIMLGLYLEGMPQYASYVAIHSVASGIVGVVNVGVISTTPLIAESYMNDKKKLAGFYITTALRWNGFLMWMLIAILVSFLPMVLEALLSLPELENYALAQAFLIPSLIHTLFRPYIDAPNGILVGCEKVSFYSFVRVFEEVLQVFFVWLFLYGIKLQENFGFMGVVIILSWEHFFPRLIKMAMCWIYINKKLLLVKINWWQTLVGPFLVSIAVFGVGELWYILIFRPFVLWIGILPTIAISLLFGMTVIPFVIYLPLSGVFGLWDDYSIETFRKAVGMSGWSKFLVKIFYKSAKWGVDHSLLHNKYKIPWEDAVKQMQELNELKQKADLELIGN